MSSCFHTLTSHKVEIHKGITVNVILSGHWIVANMTWKPRSWERNDVSLSYDATPMKENRILNTNHQWVICFINYHMIFRIFIFPTSLTNNCRSSKCLRTVLAAICPLLSEGICGSHLQLSFEQLHLPCSVSSQEQKTTVACPFVTCVCCLRANHKYLRQLTRTQGMERHRKKWSLSLSCLSLSIHSVTGRLAPLILCVGE